MIVETQSIASVLKENMGLPGFRKDRAGENKMPYVSMFFGIIIRMFHNEHNPPHFHADYQGQRGMFNFDGEMIKGNLTSKTSKQLIKQWASLHKTELQENWNKASYGKQIDRIAPLD